jgi:hypothetical protein
LFNSIHECYCFNNQNTKYYTEQVVGDLCFTRSLCVLCNPSPYSAWPICRLIWPSMLNLSESKLSPWEWSRVPWYTTECHGMQPSATKSIIAICGIAYINIVFLQNINTMFMYNTAMLSSWQVLSYPHKFWIAECLGIQPSAIEYSRVPPSP